MWEEQQQVGRGKGAWTDSTPAECGASAGPAFSRDSQDLARDQRSAARFATPPQHQVRDQRVQVLRIPLRTGKGKGSMCVTFRADVVPCECKAPPCDSKPTRGTESEEEETKAGGRGRTVGGGVKRKGGWQAV